MEVNSPRAKCTVASYPFTVHTAASRSSKDLPDTDPDCVSPRTCTDTPVQAGRATAARRLQEDLRRRDVCPCNGNNVAECPSLYSHLTNTDIHLYWWDASCQAPHPVTIMARLSKCVENSKGLRRRSSF